MPPPSRAPIDPAEPEVAEASAAVPTPADSDPAKPVRAESASRVWPWRFPRPFELCAYGGALAAYLFLRWHGLKFGWSAVQYVFLAAAGALPVVLAIGVGLRLVQHAVRRESLRDYLRRIATFSWLAHWCRLWLAGIAFAYTYTWLKVSIPLIRVDLFDPELWQLDRILHFGISPTIFAVELTAGTPLPALLDRWYALWVPSIPFCFAYATASTRDAERRHFVLANCLLWTLGAWIYLSVPALGPCYATPEILDPIRSEMPRAVSTQNALFAHYGKMIQSRGGFLESFSPVYGVAAMPSLHVGAHWLFALWARRYARALFVPLVIATAFTFFGSLVTTWHYAIDGYAGMLLAWLVIRVADRLEPAPREERSAPATSAPAAPEP